jgi:hypothetical protein
MVKIFRLTLSYVLLFIFFFSNVYGGYCRYSWEWLEKSAITSDARKMFTSKCNDVNVPIEDLTKSYKAYKKAFKISEKAYLVLCKKEHDNFKEDYFKDISRAQQKDIESSYKVLIKSYKADQKALEAETDASYKLAKANKSYYKIKKATADYRIEKAKKHYDEVRKIRDNSLRDITVTQNILNSKKKVIASGDNIFTRSRKAQEKSSRKIRQQQRQRSKAAVGKRERVKADREINLLID